MGLAICIVYWLKLQVSGVSSALLKYFLVTNMQCVVITEHNVGPVANTIGQIEQLSLELEGMMPLVNWLYLQLRARPRRFLSHWGAIGQATGNWGQDFTNVIYTTAWQYLVSERTGDYFQAGVVTSLNNSGNMLEMSFGLMYLVDRNYATYADFVKDCNDKDMSWATKEYPTAWKLLSDHEPYLAKLSAWREKLEKYVIGWHSLLREHCIETFGAWTTNRTFDGPRILSAYECLRMGWPPNDKQLFEDMFKRPGPPSSFLLCRSSSAMSSASQLFEHLPGLLVTHTFRGAGLAAAGSQP